MASWILGVCFDGRPELAGSGRSFRHPQAIADADVSDWSKTDIPRCLAGF